MKAVLKIREDKFQDYQDFKNSYLVSLPEKSEEKGKDGYFTYKFRGANYIFGKTCIVYDGLPGLLGGGSLYWSNEYKPHIACPHLTKFGKWEIINK
jgi:hypothetical protein